MAVASEAALCAHDQGQFKAYQHALYENQGAMAFNPSSLATLALNVGLDEAQFRECLSSRKNQSLVEGGRQAALNRGVNSTPTFFINSQRVEGNQPYNQFKQIIDQQLAASGQ